jgi:type IX secretion system PorP/SprF family membrane protein
MKKIINIITIVFLLTQIAMGQQEMMLTKYTYNSLFFNPAYAGSHGLGEGTLIAHYRNQWINLEGAPKTILLGGEASLSDNRLGVGVMFGKESLGVESRTDGTINTAYRIQLGNGQLAAGLRVGFSSFSNNFSRLTIKDPGDVFDIPNYQINLFSVGTGVYYNTDGLYFGVAVPNIAVISSSKNGIGDRSKHFYLHTGLMIGDEYSTIKFEPSILMKYQKAAPLQFTLGVNAWLRENIAIGGHYRSNDALALSAELHLSKQIRIGFAYDFTLSEIKKHSDGSLEFFIGYKFNTAPNDPKVKNLRYGGRF